MIPSLSFSRLSALVAFALAGLALAGGALEQSREQSRVADEASLVQVGLRSQIRYGATTRKRSASQKDVPVDPRPDAFGKSARCSEADRAIPFKAYKADESQDPDRRLFLAELGAATSPSEVLYTSRHRTNVHDQDLPPGSRVPKFMRMFDWYQLGEEQNLTHPHPKTIMCMVTRKDLCWKHIKTLPALQAGEERLLAMGNGDLHVSKSIQFIKDCQSGGRFTRIVYEAMDMRMPGVGTFPLGLSDIYIAMSGMQNVMKAIREASLQKKDKQLLAAWGKVWDFLDDRLSSRRSAQKFVDSSCFVNRTMIEHEDYFEVLSQHRFLLAPSGNGIQSPKVAEALAVLTIPIVDWTPAYADLVAAGWPMVLVRRWEEITPSSLVRWHAELSPKLHAFRLRLTASRAFDELVHGP